MKIKLFYLLILISCYFFIGSEQTNYQPMNTNHWQIDLHRSLINSLKHYSHRDKVAAMYVQKHGGGRFDQNLEAIIPNNPEEIRSHIIQLREKIYMAIGEITPKEFLVDEWVNSAGSIEELMSDAECGAQELRLAGQDTVSSMQHAVLSFGDESKYILKSKYSIENKIRRIQEKNNLSHREIVGLINDATRGTIITDNVHDLLTSIGLFKAQVYKRKWKIVFSNYWAENRPDGYVGINAMIHMPLQNGHWVLAEMQFHLREILETRKKSHILYELQKEGMDCNDAMTLLYASALDEIANYLVSAPLSAKAKKIISDSVFQYK